MKKIITELTDEELLEIIKNKPEGEELYFKNDVTDFISFYNIKSGRFKVPPKLLYKLYVRWSEIPVQHQTFTTTLTDLFPHIKKGQYYTLLLNRDTFNLKSTLDLLGKKNNKIKQKRFKQHFDKFLEKYEIKRGKKYIKNEILYNLYDKWTYKNNNKNPLGVAQFNNFCKLYFNHKVVNQEFCFAINESLYKHLTEEIVTLIKEKHAKQKEKSKIKREISRFREKFKSQNKN